MEPRTSTVSQPSQDELAHRLSEQVLDRRNTPLYTHQEPQAVGVVGVPTPRAVETSDSSIDLAVRIEMIWTSRLQARLERWSTRVLDGVAGHKKAAKQKKRIFKGLLISSTLLTLCISIMMPYLDHDLTFAVLLSVAACLTAVNGALDFGGVAQRHLSAEAQLSRLALRIGYILDQPKSNRAPADVVMTELRYEIAEIESAAPDIP